MKRKLWLLHVWGDVEPHVLGPYATEQTRLRAARRVRHADADLQDGIFMIDSPTRPIVDSYSGGALS